MIKISTIIATFNAAQYLREAIDSALAQTYQDQEIIVVDDGSTDATPEILASYGNRIRSVSQKNGGQVAARNHGAAISSGEWLAFLDADDVWLPEKLTRQLSTAGDAALVYTSRVNFGQIERVAEQQADASELCSGDVFERLLETNFITLSSVIMRRTWFERLGGFAEPRGCEDWDLWLRLAAAGGLVAVVREPLTQYRWHNASTSANERSMCSARLQVVEHALASERGRALANKLANRARADAWCVSAWHAAGSEFWKPLAWYMKAAWYCPWSLEPYKGMVKCMLRRS